MCWHLLGKSRTAYGRGQRSAEHPTRPDLGLVCIDQPCRRLVASVCQSYWSLDAGCCMSCFRMHAQGWCAVPSCGAAGLSWTTGLPASLWMMPAAFARVRVYIPAVRDWLIDYSDTCGIWVVTDYAWYRYGSVLDSELLAQGAHGDRWQHSHKAAEVPAHEGANAAVLTISPHIEYTNYKLPVHAKRTLILTAFVLLSQAGHASARL